MIKEIYRAFLEIIMEIDIWNSKLKVEDFWKILIMFKLKVSFRNYIFKILNILLYKFFHKKNIF